MVWGAWMNPETLPQWWGPDGFSCRTKRIDLRAGGEWVFDMIGPDGTVFPNHHRYIEVRPEERIGYTLLLGRERAETCRRLGLVRGSGRGDEGDAGHGLQHGCRVPGGEGLRCRGTGTANSGQAGTLRRIPLKCCDFPYEIGGSNVSIEFTTGQPLRRNDRGVSRALCAGSAGRRAAAGLADLFLERVVADGADDHFLGGHVGGRAGQGELARRARRPRRWSP